MNSVLQWVTSALYGSYIAANILKWHWWRFNGRGFALGMAAGMIPALILPIVPYFDGVLPLYYFPIIFICSIVGCVWGTYSVPPTDLEVLKEFYKTTRPWGIWKPIDVLVKAETPDFKENSDCCRDLINVGVGIIWQTALVAASIYLVLQQFIYFIVAVIIVIITSVILKRNWFNKLEN